MTAKKISVIIPAYNEEEQIGRCLDSVFGDDYTKEKLEVFVIIDDGSKDRTEEIARSYPIKVIDTGANRGLSSARNAGIEAAEGEILLFIDADAVISKGSLKEHERLQKDYDIVYCPYFQGSDKGVLSCYNEIYSKVFWSGGQGINFNNTSYKRHIFDKLRFDENIRSWGCEDIDMFNRMKVEKYKTIKTDNIYTVHSPHEKNLYRFFLRNFMYGYNLPIYTMKYFSLWGFSKSLIIPALAVISLLYLPLGLLLAFAALMLLHPSIFGILKMAKKAGWIYLLPFFSLALIVKTSILLGAAIGLPRAVKINLGF